MPDSSSRALGTPTKAVITNWDKQSDKFECLFNPSEYSYSMTNNWTPKRANMREMSHLEYSGGDNSTLTLDLFFDTVEPRKMGGQTISEPGHKRREVMPQDTLALIAYQEYGTPNRWRAIAEANDIEDPLDLRPGQVLAIPPA